MPGANGFELLAQLDRVPLVIFTTAYDDYALKAFEVNALDYLLKPVAPERLAAALAKIAARQGEIAAWRRPADFRQRRRTVLVCGAAGNRAAGI